MRSAPTLLATAALLGLSACSSGSTTEEGAIPADSDGDGVLDRDEEALGTDPTRPDTDGDGWGDGEELDAGSDPLLCWDVVQGWPDCRAQALAEGVTETGWDIGDTLGEWDAVDQFGVEIDAYRFYSQVIVLDMSAGWCEPCNTAAASAEADYQRYKADGVIFIHLMIDDLSQDGFVTDDTFIASWADQYGLTAPVLMDDDHQGYAVPYAEFYFNDLVQGIPTYAIIGRDMRLKSIWSGYDAELQAAEIEAQL